MIEVAPWLPSGGSDPLFDHAWLDRSRSVVVGAAMGRLRSVKGCVNRWFRRDGVSESREVVAIDDWTGEYRPPGGDLSPRRLIEGRLWSSGWPLLSFDHARKIVRRPGPRPKAEHCRARAATRHLAAAP
ncbi:hypothetical protein OHA72_13590 [Dactylosporangium sp. NBC_01737]|uniref:hypothetical protein n=1 Tax=Dactylosporangium sp. NBC_01737 TaxID=2975959 RepID=UPI002E0DEE1B|nr:hypothetical protein OHA72_13590 [Dactylosporangium sp. NBC_01737]